MLKGEGNDAEGRKKDVERTPGPKPGTLTIHDIVPPRRPATRRIPDIFLTRFRETKST